VIERAWAYIAHRADECERGRDGNERARSARRLFLVFFEIARTLEEYAD
jgi:hypothetical protein